MSAFDLGRAVEEKGMAILRPFLRQISDGGRYVEMSKGALAKMLQETVGDVIYTRRGGAIAAVEIKVEEDNKWGNFFLETWSNRDFDRANQGWIYKLVCDYLWYYFVEPNELHVLDYRRLWEWAHIRGRLYSFPEKPQSKYVQLNKTFGRCVPISVLTSEVKSWKLAPGSTIIVPPTPPDTPPDTTPDTPLEPLDLSQATQGLLWTPEPPTPYHPSTRRGAEVGR